MFKISLEVRIPKDIEEYQEKILFGLSIRQLCSFAVAIVLGATVYYFGKKLIGKEVTSYIVILITMPIFGFGFFKKNGFNFEKYILIVIKQKLATGKRVYQTDLSINKLLEGENNDAKKPIKKRDRRRNKKEREHKVFEVTKKDRKRKSKEVSRKIKDAREQYKIAKQRVKEEVKTKETA